MPDIRFLVPHQDRVVRDPITGRPLPADGTHVNLQDPRRRTYFNRRIKDGDVTVGQPPVPPVPKTKPEPGED